MIEPKQVIVIRKDLNMRRGKSCAQAAHASMAALLNSGAYQGDKFMLVLRTDLIHYH